MAQWTELVIEGSDDVARAFVTGFVAGRGGNAQAEVVHARDVDLEPVSLGDRLRELLRASSHVVVFAGPALAAPLRAALQEQGRPHGLVLESERAVASARVDVRAELASREASTRLREVIARSGRTLRFEAHQETEEEHAEGKGVELYAPLHEYTYRMSATLAGGVGDVVAIVRELRHLGCEVGRLHLTAAS